jgi:hypothetical protein
MQACISGVAFACIIYARLVLLEALVCAGCVIVHVHCGCGKVCFVCKSDFVLKM